MFKFSNAHTTNALILKKDDALITPTRDTVCITGYDSGKPNYALSNFDDNSGKGWYFWDPDLGAQWFLTSEAYLHLQKIDTANKLTVYNSIKDKKASEVLPMFKGGKPPGTNYNKNISPRIQKEGGNFDPKKWDDEFSIAVQMQINVTKYFQSDQFKQCIHNSIALGAALGGRNEPVSILEDTSSAKFREEIWGTGANGQGLNKLGNTQTALAMALKDKKKDVNAQKVVVDTKEMILPTLDQFLSDATAHQHQRSEGCKKYYEDAEKQYKEGIQKTFQEVRKNAGKAGTNKPAKGVDTWTKQDDTSDLGDQYVKKVTKIEDIKDLNASKPISFKFVKTIAAPATELNISFQTKEFTKDELKKIHNGLEIDNNENFTVSMKYNSKEGLSLGLSTKVNTKEDEKKDTPDIVAKKQKAALNMLLTAFANSVDNKPIVISGSNPKLVAFAKHAAEQINQHLPAGVKREIKVSGLPEKSVYDPKNNFAKITKDFKFTTNGNTFDFSNKPWEGFITPGITAEDRDSVYQTTLKR